jgi:iron complex outermembrane receptor protein
VGPGSFVFRAGARRRSGDVRTPEGRVATSQAWAATGDVALSWVGANWYAGGNYGYDDSRYGVPVVESGLVELTPRRQTIDFRVEGQKLNGFITSTRVSVGVRRYRHDELDAGQIGTTFRNNTAEFDAHLHHRAIWRFKGTFGAWGLVRAFDAVGAEALSPPVDQRGVAAFAYEEMNLKRFDLEFSGRFDHTAYSPKNSLPSRSFDVLSGSAGFIVHATSVISLAASFSYVTRPPALEELYFRGPHPGNFAFEVGNPSLGAERAKGIDLALRWQHKRTSGEISYFRNAIGDYVLRNYTGDFAGDFPVVEFVGSRALTQGFEAHADVRLARSIYAQTTIDYVHGEITSLGQPMPRIPPFRFRGGLRYDRNALQIGGDVTAAARQARVFGYEQPTAGYGLLKLYVAYTFPHGRTANTITATLDNATNELYRSHLSLIKELAPEMGRNFKVLYNVKF